VPGGTRKADASAISPKFTWISFASIFIAWVL
jgi:hypothetical protein